MCCFCSHYYGCFVTVLPRGALSESSRIIRRQIKGDDYLVGHVAGLGHLGHKHPLHALPKLLESEMNPRILASAQRLWCLELLLVLLVFLVDLLVDALEPQSCLSHGGLLESLRPRD